ncbi:unnamed protein product [Ilex paraguariensis]|uniref:LOB domain-containing protein n=1 Tax=Ilex paraguariensis TaxID=185542 RepID=A0ABC8SMI1_9AQUA
MITTSPGNHHIAIAATPTTTRVGQGPGGTTSSQACAACKYQRRKCAPNCPLAPYFPPDHQKQFLNAHKLFGVSNIMKVLRNLAPFEKEIAMKTMILQANIRANDPVGGCYRMISQLQRQIAHHKRELDIVLHQLAICRSQPQMAQQEMLNPSVAATIHRTDTVNVDLLSAYDPMHDIQAIRVGTVGDSYESLSFMNEPEDIKPLVGVLGEKQQVLTESKK